MAERIIAARVEYLRLKREATERGLLGSPPYGSIRERDCWVNGYLTALDDLADGKLSRTSPRKDA